MADVRQGQVGLFNGNQAKLDLFGVLSLSLFELNLRDAFFDHLLKTTNEALSKDSMREIGPVDQESLDH